MKKKYVAFVLLMMFLFSSVFTSTNILAQDINEETNASSESNTEIVIDDSNNTNEQLDDSQFQENNETESDAKSDTDDANETSDNNTITEDGTGQMDSSKEFSNENEANDASNDDTVNDKTDELNEMEEETDNEDADKELVSLDLEKTHGDYIVKASGLMPEGTELSVVKLDDNAQIENSIESAIDGINEFEPEVTFDIKLLYKNGEYQPSDFDNTIKISILGIDRQEELSVYRITNDGSVTNMNATNIDNGVEFITDHFTKYTAGVIIRKEDILPSSYMVSLPTPIILEESENNYTATFNVEIEGYTMYKPIVEVKSDPSIRLIGDEGNVDLFVDAPAFESHGDSSTADEEKYLHSNNATFTIHTMTKDIIPGNYTGTLNFTYKVITEEEHEHVEALPSEENVVESTCTQEGSYDEVVYCASCRSELSRTTKTIPLKPHEWSDWIWKDNHYEKHCNNCDAIETTDKLFTLTLKTSRGIKKVYGANKYKPGEEVRLDALLYDCNDFGSWKENGKVISEDINYTFKMPESNVTLTAYGTPNGSDTGHEWGSTTSIAATCTTDSVEYAACRHCDATLVTHNHKKLGHIGYEVERKEPTCLDNGYITMHCTRCGENWTEKYKDAHGHVYADTYEYEWGFAGKKYIRRCVYCGKQEMEPGKYGLFTYNTSSRRYVQTRTWDDLLRTGIFSIDKNGTLILDGVNTKTKVSTHAGELNGTLVLPETVKRIDSSSLYYLDGLKELYIPSTVNTISFHYGSIRNLEEIHVSKDNESFVVTNNALYSSDHKRLVAAMKNYTGAFKVDDRCEEISKYALYETDYWYVYLPESVKTIGDSAFKDMNNIVTIEIPSSVTKIGKGLINFSGKLKRIDVDGDNTKYTSIDGALYSADLKSILNVPNTKTGTFKIPETVSRIEANAFDHCKKLTGITIPEYVNYIGGYAFADCEGLKSLKLPSGITSIYEGTLSKVGCKITIPAAVEYIGYSNAVNNNVSFEDTSYLWKMQLTNNGKTSSKAPTGTFNVKNSSTNKTLLNECIYYEWFRQ